MALQDKKDTIRKAFVSYVSHATEVLNKPQSFEPTTMEVTSLLLTFESSADMLANSGWTGK
jgi:hypothetical protein